MANLPEDFIRDTKLLMGEVRFNRFMEALNEDAPVSIRLNPKHSPCRCEKEDNVPWCTEGYYLKGRPQFTFDPLFHAGCYYVQEASSMFVSHCWRSSRNGAGLTASSPTTTLMTSVRRRYCLTSSSAMYLALEKACSVRILIPSTSGAYRM